jgi:small subunit ribosomal protein S5
VVKGGKRMSFRACLVIGNNKGEIGYGVAKGADVSMAIDKALRYANKSLIKVPIVNDTIPYEVREKYKAARILLRPASRGHGIVAGGVLRIVLSLAGVKNVTGKILGSKSKINNVKAVFKALDSFNKTIK